MGYDVEKKLQIKEKSYEISSIKYLTLETRKIKSLTRKERSPQKKNWL